MFDEEWPFITISPGIWLEEIVKWRSTATDGRGFVWTRGLFFVATQRGDKKCLVIPSDNKVPESTSSSIQWSELSSNHNMELPSLQPPPTCYSKANEFVRCVSSFIWIVVVRNKFRINLTWRVEQIEHSSLHPGSPEYSRKLLFSFIFRSDVDEEWVPESRSDGRTSKIE